MTSKTYITDIPEWIIDWDYEENTINPSEVTKGSRISVSWKCHVCGGKWPTVVKDRRGCPFCSNFRALEGFNDLATLRPDIAAEWDYLLNGDLKPTDVTVGSKKEVNWICEKGHSWSIDVYSRTRGNGCPYCSNRKVLVGYNDLATVNPELASEWDYERNAPLTPEMFVAGSKDSVHWLCSKGHSWTAKIANRNKGTGCAVCANRIIVKGVNDFATLHPELLTEWDYEMNKKSPSDYAEYARDKVRWICKRGHSYPAVIGERSRGSGCAKCLEERRVSFPEKAICFYVSKYIDGVIANYRNENIAPYEIDVFIPKFNLGIEYDGVYGHSKANGIARDKKKNKLCLKNGITLIRIRENACPPTNDTSIDYTLSDSNDVSEGILFIFEYIQKHYDSTILFNSSDINLKEDSGAIYSLIEFSEKENSIVKLAPEIAKMWHPTKNGRVNPEYISVGSTKSFRWLGECGHDWPSEVHNMVKGSGKCPYCTGKRVLVGFNDLATCNPELAAEWDYKSNGNLKPENVTAGSGKEIRWICPKGHSYPATIAQRKRGDGCSICSNRRVEVGVNDVASNSMLMESWNFDKNIGIDPKTVCVGSSSVYYWWKCPKCAHEWKAPVSKRVAGSECPKCSDITRQKTRRKNLVAKKGSLADTYPELMEEWNWDNKIDPHTITSGYGKKVSWICKKCHQSWEATVISRRNGRGCKYCADEERAKSRQANLLKSKNPITITNPDIMLDWDFDANIDLEPTMLTAGSGKSAKWKCHICGHVWNAQICERTRGKSKCSQCR